MALIDLAEKFKKQFSLQNIRAQAQALPQFTRQTPFAQNLRTTLNKPAPNNAVTRGLVKIARPLEQPLRQYGTGFTQASTFGLANPKAPPITNFGSAAGYGLGFAAGILNPINPINKFGIWNKIGQVGARPTSAILSRIAPKATGFAAKKLIPSFASEVAQSTAYGLAKKSLGQPFNFTTDLATGLVLRGGLGKFQPDLAAPKVGFKMDSRTFDDVIQAEDMIRNPKKFLGTITTGARTEKDALKKIQLMGVETVERVAAKHLPTKDIQKLKSPLAIVKRLVDLNEQNKLANVPVSGFVQTKAVKPESKPLARIKKAQEEALEVSIKPTAKVKEVAPVKISGKYAFGVRTPEKPGGISRPSGKSIAQDKYSFNVNMNRLDLTNREKQTLKTTIETIKPELQSIKGKKLGNDEILRAAKTTEMLNNVVTRDQTKQAEAALLKARQNVTTLDKEIDQLVKGGNTKKLQAKMGELIESLRVVSSNAADAGRKLQSLSIDAGDESVRATILKDISKTNAGTEEILREASKVDWENANSVAKFYRKFIKPSATEILDEYRYNNMLSNPRTHIRNAFSNLVQTFITRPATLLAQGKAGGTAKYYRGALQSLPDAFGAFSDSITGKAAIAKPDIEHISTQKLPGFLTLPTRSMEAMDRFFTTIIRGGELSRGATLKEAQDIAEYSLFRQGLKPEGQGRLLNAIDDATEGVYHLGRKVPVLRWFVPFVRTPMNFAKQWVEYSPTGLATIPGAKNKGEQLAKTMLGSVVTFAGAKLALDGNTTWAAPTDPKEKELFYASGRKPYSFRVGDKWVSMMYAGPFAPALAIPAATKYYQDESRTALTDTQMEKLQKISMSMAEFLSGQTFMEGLGNFVSLFKGDVDYTIGKNVGYTASQLIPLQGLVRWASTVVDPIYRKTKTAEEQIRSTIPFASKTLEPYTNPMGEPSTRERINLITPYDITPTNEMYEPMLKQRTEKLQSNALENKAVKDIESSKGGNLSVNNKFLYWDDESASVKKINLDFEIEKPKLTGVKNVDSRLISAYKTKLTNKENDVIKLMELGQISQEEGIAIIEGMEGLRKAISSTGGKKGKNVTIRKVSLKPVKLTKSKGITIQTIKMPKSPNLKRISVKAIKITGGVNKVPQYKIKTFKNTLTQGIVKLA